MKVKHIVIGLCGAAAIGGTVWYLTRKPKGNGDTSGDEFDATEFDMIPPDTLGSTPKNSGAYSSGGGATSIAPTPFKNATEGNAFRAWVNKNYPDKAKTWKLDPTGSYDNQYIRKAYSELGSTYSKSLGDKSYASQLDADKKRLEDLYNASTKLMTVVIPKGSNPEVAKKGFINLRSTSEINDGTFNNRVKELKIGESAEFVQNTSGVSDRLDWYKVKIKNPSNPSTTRFAYVRSDVAEKKTIRVPKVTVTI